MSCSVKATTPSSIAPLASNGGELGLEEAHALAQRGAEALLLAGDDLRDELAVLDDLGVRLAHELDDALDEADEERVLDAEKTPVAHRAAQQAAQHVAAALVAREDAVGDQEGHRARVVGDDAQRGRRLLVGAVVGAGDLLGERHEVAQDVGLEVRVHALQDRGDALEAHAGVDVLLGQRHERAVLGAVVLHEDEVPVLEVAVAVAADRAVRAVAAELRALVVVELRARAARAGGAGGPEVVLGAHAHDALGRHADLVDPDRLGLVVVLVDRDPDALRVEPEHLDRVLPRPRGCLGLEVVAEAEVAEHLEEAVVAAGGADDVDVGGAHALLHGGRAREPRSFTPRNTGLNCTMPAVVSSSEGSSGMSEEDGWRVQPLLSK